MMDCCLSATENVFSLLLKNVCSDETVQGLYIRLTDDFFGLNPGSLCKSSIQIDKLLVFIKEKDAIGDIILNHLVQTNLISQFHFRTILGTELDTDDLDRLNKIFPKLIFDLFEKELEL